MKTNKAHRPRAAAEAVDAPNSTGTSLWPYAAMALVALIAVFFVYGPALDGPYFLDDTYLAYAQPANVDSPLSAWLHDSRPLLMFSYWLNVHLGSQETSGFHLVNILLHLLNAGLIFLVVRKVLQQIPSDPFTREILATFAAGLFLLHPLQTESVSYIASRSEDLSVFFFLGAFALFLYRQLLISWPVALGVLGLFALACLTKEHAAALPLLLFLTDYYWNPGFTVAGARRNWRLYALILAGGVLALAFVWRVLSRASSAGFGMKDLPWYQYFFTQCRAIWRYILLLVLPIGQNIDHDFPTSRTILDHGAILGLVGLLALIAAAWIYRRHYSLISYGIFTFLILLAPTSSFVPIQDTLVERRMYLPFIGFLFVVVGLLLHWKISRPILVGVLGLVLLIEGGLAYGRNRLWGSPTDMWADSVKKSPSKLRPRFQLAYAYLNANQCQESMDEFAKAAQLQPPTASLLVDWGLAADCAGKFSEALAHLQQALTVEKTAHIYTEVAREYAKLNLYPQALDALESAAKIDPNYEMIYAYRGKIDAMRGDKAGAAAEYRRALEIDPQNQLARQGLSELSARP